MIKVKKSLPFIKQQLWNKPWKDVKGRKQKYLRTGLLFLVAIMV